MNPVSDTELIPFYQWKKLRPFSKACLPDNLMVRNLDSVATFAMRQRMQSPKSSSCSLWCWISERSEILNFKRNCNSLVRFIGYGIHWNRGWSALFEIKSRNKEIRMSFCGCTSTRRILSRGKSVELLPHCSGCGTASTKVKSNNKSYLQRDFAKKRSDLCILLTDSQTEAFENRGGTIVNASRVFPLNSKTNPSIPNPPIDLGKWIVLCTQSISSIMNVTKIGYRHSSIQTRLLMVWNSMWFSINITKLMRNLGNQRELQSVLFLGCVRHLELLPNCPKKAFYCFKIQDCCNRMKLLGE